MRWQVPGYVLEEFVGFGGFGDIWRALCATSGRVVALNRLRGAAVRRRAVDRFERTVRTAAHPHLAELYDVQVVGEDIVVVTEYLPGGRLDAVLEERSLTLGELITLVVPIAGALQHVHDHGLVHGNVVAEHVAFTTDGRPVLTGLAIRDLVGEPGEAAGCALDPMVDVYSLAALARRCLAAGAVVTRTDADYDSDAVEEAVPEELVTAIERGLSPRPAERGSAAELAGAVRAAGTPEPVRLPTPAATEAGSGAPEGTDLDGAWRKRLLGQDPNGTNKHGRHAAATRRSRLGSGRPRRIRRPFLPAVLRRSRSGSAVMAGLIAILVIAAVVWVGAWWSGPGANPRAAAELSAAGTRASINDTGPVPEEKASAAPATTSPSATPADVQPVADVTADPWSVIVQDLYDARVKAFTAADGDFLDAVYVGGSPQLASDLASIESLAAEGRTLSGFQLTVASTEVIASDADQVELRVVDSYGPFDVVSAGEVVASDPGRAPADVSTILRRTGEGWRILTARLLT